MSVTGKGTKLKSAWLLRGRGRGRGLLPLRDQIQWGDNDSIESIVWDDWFFEASAPSPTNYSLTCSSGTYTETGNAATFSYKHFLIASVGTYNVTGNQATLSRSSSLSCSSGTYLESGNSSTLLYARSVSGASGSYSISGYTTTLNRASSLSSAVGSYAITGNAATLTYTPGAAGVNYTLTCDVGSYAITGNVATFDYDHFLSLSSGAYSVTGSDATFTLVQKVDYALSGETGSYLLNGNQAILTYVTTEDSSSRGLGGDDVPIRYEIWEKRAKRNRHAFDEIVDKSWNEISNPSEPVNDLQEEADIDAISIIGSKANDDDGIPNEVLMLLID